MTQLVWMTSTPILTITMRTMKGVRTLEMMILIMEILKTNLRMINWKKGKSKR